MGRARAGEQAPPGDDDASAGESRIARALVEVDVGGAGWSEPAGIDMLGRLKESLPDFPDEVLTDWLLPFADAEGWPPAGDAESTPTGRWIFLLDGRPLRYWRSLRWSQIERHVSFNDLGIESRGIMIQIVLGAVAKQRNNYTDAIHNLRPRFWRVVEHIRHSGRLPKPPTLLAASDGLSILDGNHRMAAYLYCYGYFKLDPGRELQLKTEEVQRYWIAAGPTTD